MADFGRNRTMRLIPPLILIVPICFATASLGGINEFHLLATPWNLIPSMTLINPEILSMSVGKDFQWVMGVQWTLSVEVTFYILASVVFFYVSRRKIIEILLVVACLISGVFVFIGRFDSHYAVIVRRILEVLGVNYSFYFLAGMCLYRIRYQIQPRLNFGIYIWCLLVCELVASGGRRGFQEGYSFAFASALIFAIFTLTAFAILKSQYMGLLRSRILVGIGNASYELYLVHEVVGVLAIFELSMKLHLGPKASLLLAIIVLVGLIYMSILIERLWSSRLRGYLDMHIRQMTKSL
jgi:peptidoglycan/LPS O-acetylase OafA/YrhL